MPSLIIRIRIIRHCTIHSSGASEFQNATIRTPAVTAIRYRIRVMSFTSFMKRVWTSFSGTRIESPGSTRALINPRSPKAIHFHMLPIQAERLRRTLPSRTGLISPIAPRNTSQETTARRAIRITLFTFIPEVPKSSLLSSMISSKSGMNCCNCVEIMQTNQSPYGPGTGATSKTGLDFPACISV